MHDTHASTHAGLGHRCPHCGAPVERVHRHALDRWLSVLRSVHRYRCTSAACGWEGLLHRLSVEPAVSATRLRRIRLLWFLIGVAASLAAVQGYRLLRQLRASPPPARVVLGGAELQSRATPPGEDFDGEALPTHDERVLGNRTPLTLRRSCSWGVPGGNRYRGTVEQALHAAQLPAEVVHEIADRAARGWTNGQVEISRAGIRSVDGQRDYGPRTLAMAFGNTMCFDTRVNFVPGHVEYAALYRADDRQGRSYTVIVPYVCQNVAVMGERAEAEGNGHATPEPAGWALVALGAVLAAAIAGRRRREPS